MSEKSVIGQVLSGNRSVWLYFRFPLSFREVEELMIERDVVVSYETVRRWCLKFGQACANGHTTAAWSSASARILSWDQPFLTSVLE
ncbi:hypothetical protein OG331_50965 [Streptomyces sp. NBC_01017]|nr:hypothetical protein OG331_01010 [Streptomyces sp. NBC_01017]WSV36022.1 hypothetical protein OG331_50965 [Streptomyces sp. NBC_01017]